jgi:hypothetical protein
MHLTAVLRRHGAALAVLAGLGMFAGAIGGLTGIDRQLQASATSPAGLATPGPAGAPGPVRVSAGTDGRDCSGLGRDTRRRDHSPHDGQEV